MQRITVAQIGARRHYAVPCILHRAGRLEELVTDLCASSAPMNWAGRLLPTRCRPSGLRALLDRTVPGIPPQRIRSLPWYGLRRAVRRRSMKSRGDMVADFLRANREFCRLVARVGLGNADAVYAFNGAALEIFRAAAGIDTILDQTSAPVEVEEQLLRDEHARWPEWESPQPTPAAAEFAERERQEWQLARTIVCGSDFVREAVTQVSPDSAAKCATAFYGVARTDLQPRLRRRHERGLRVLFVGHVRLLKGIPYLLEAAQQLKRSDIEWRLVGGIGVSDQAASGLRRHFDMPGAVPRSTLPQVYDWADVLVLPSLCEGSANVAYEALVSGVPVVATQNSGTIVRDGEDGFVVPIRSAEALADRVARLADNPDLLAALSEGALRRGPELTGNAYGTRLLAALGIAS